MSADNLSLWLAGPSHATAGPARTAVVADDVLAAEPLEEIYRTHAAAVVRWAARLLGPDGDPDDVAHEVFLVVQRRLSEFRGEAKVATWLYEITTRVAQAHRRHARRWHWLKADRAGSAPSWLSGFGPAQGQRLDQDPQQLVERQNDTRLIYAVLGRLAEKYRTALILYHLEGLSVPQICQVLRISESNVYARLSRGRSKFLARWAIEAPRPAPFDERQER